jgi:hypothetical protein
LECSIAETGGIFWDGNGGRGGHTQNVKYVREKQEKSCN